MKLTIIRHFKTPGNLEHRYIGSTDEHLAPVEKIQTMAYPKAEILVSSPMIRCIETAELIYKRQPDLQEADLREKDFGAYEGKNYEELKDERSYCKWLGSEGTLPFPEGEKTEVFCKRVEKGFDACVRQLISKHVQNAAFIVHGGTIMAILSAYAEREGSFYDWQIENGNGYQVLLSEKDWLSGRKKLVEIQKLW